jgi:purine-binding chemotaxis protein CheW
MQASYMSFRVADLLLGVPAEQVIEVSRSAELTRLPQSAGHVLGLINLRGALAVGIDLARCLRSLQENVPAPAPMDSGLWVFAQTVQGLIGLRVDAVNDIHAVQTIDLGSAPVSLQGALGRMVCATVSLPETLMHVLALDEIPLQAHASFSISTDKPSI